MVMVKLHRMHRILTERRSFAAELEHVCVRRWRVNGVMPKVEMILEKLVNHVRQWVVHLV